MQKVELYLTAIIKNVPWNMAPCLPVFARCYPGKSLKRLDEVRLVGEVTFISDRCQWKVSVVDQVNCMQVFFIAQHLFCIHPRKVIDLPG